MPKEYVFIPADDMLSYLHLDSDFIPFGGPDNNSEYAPSEEQVTNTISFLNELIK